MKKTTLFIFLLSFSFGFSQTLTSGEITLEAGRTVQFDVNTTTDIVTMTMVFPENTWLGIGMSQGTEYDIALGQGMGDLDDDAVIGLSTGIMDRNMNAGTGQPPLDAQPNDWTVVSNTVAAGVRTIVGTRARDTGDTEDTIFPNTEMAFPLIYAKGGSTFGYHGGGNYGAAMATLATLSNPEFDVPAKFAIFPNPGNDIMNIELPSLTDEGLQMEVYNVLGKKILTKTIKDLSSTINISEWNSGVYLVKMTAENGDITLTKRFVKL